MSDLTLTEEQRRKLARCIWARANLLAEEGRQEGEGGGDAAELLYGAITLGQLADDIQDGEFP